MKEEIRTSTLLDHVKALNTIKGTLEEVAGMFDDPMMNLKPSQVRGMCKQAINALISGVHQNAVSKGFWDKERNDGEAMALIHSEVSEALEAMRHGNPESEKIPGFSSVEEELADIVIRVFDYAGGRELNLTEAIYAKCDFNAGRERLHGKEF